MKTRNVPSTLGVVVTAAFLATLAGCSGDAVNAAEAEGVPMLPNTASVLFPIHNLDPEQLEREKAAFWLNETAFAAQEITVQKVSEVHTGPGATYDIVDVLAPGDEITIDGRVGHWLRIADHGGFVSSLTAEGIPWETTVDGEGDDEAVDACTGGLIEFERITIELGRPYYALHSNCGGEPVLNMKVGDTLKIDGYTYYVVDARRVGLSGNSDAVADMDGQALIHTCDLVHGESAVVGVNRMMS